MFLEQEVLELKKRLNRVEHSLRIVQKRSRPTGNDRRIFAVMDFVAQHFGYARADLQGNRGNAHLATARQIAITLCHELYPAITHGELSAHFGGRTHANVRYAVRVIKNRCDTEEAFAETVKELRAQLTQN